MAGPPIVLPRAQDLGPIMNESFMPAICLSSALIVAAPISFKASTLFRSGLFGKSGLIRISML